MFVILRVQQPSFQHQTLDDCTHTNRYSSTLNSEQHLVSELIRRSFSSSSYCRYLPVWEIFSSVVTILFGISFGVIAYKLRQEHYDNFGLKNELKAICVVALTAMLIWFIWTNVPIFVDWNCNVFPLENIIPMLIGASGGMIVSIMVPLYQSYYHQKQTPFNDVTKEIGSIDFVDNGNGNDGDGNDNDNHDEEKSRSSDRGDGDGDGDIEQEEASPTTMSGHDEPVAVVVRKRSDSVKALPLKDILRDDEGRSRLKQFLASEFNVETISFWHTVELFKELCREGASKSATTKRARYIARTYIQSGTLLEVNIGAHHVVHILDALNMPRTNVKTAIDHIGLVRHINELGPRSTFVSSTLHLHQNLQQPSRRSVSQTEAPLDSHCSSSSTTDDNAGSSTPPTDISTIFNSAQLEIFCLIERDPFVRFLQTESYREYFFKKMKQSMAASTRKKCSTIRRG